MYLGRYIIFTTVRERVIITFLLKKIHIIATFVFTRILNGIWKTLG